MNYLLTKHKQRETIFTKEGEAEALPVEVIDDIFENFIVHRRKFSHNFLKHLQSFVMVYDF